jgi:hypothetical protein
VVLYERETWSLTLRDEHRVRIFENRTLREIFESISDEVIGNLTSGRKLEKSA